MNEWLTIENATEFIHHSNAIENIHHSEKWIMSTIKTNVYIPEITNHYEALKYVTEQSGLPDVAGIKMLHEILMKDLLIQLEENKNGEYRDYDVRVGSHRCPPFQEVEGLMTSLDDAISFSINLRNEKTGAERAWTIHDSFEQIHPFGDGNGRVGRLLLNWIRRHYGLPMLIVKYEDRFKYYNKIHKERKEK